MSSKPSYNISVPVMRLSIAFSLMLAALAFYLYISWEKVDSVEKVQNAPLLVQAQQLNQTIEFDIQTLQRCLSARYCSTTELDFEVLKDEIDQFKSLASLNKTEFSLVGATEYTQLELAINRFSDSQKKHATMCWHCTSRSPITTYKWTTTTGPYLTTMRAT